MGFPILNDAGLAKIFDDNRKLQRQVRNKQEQIKLLKQLLFEMRQRFIPNNPCDELLIKTDQLLKKLKKASK